MALMTVYEMVVDILNDMESDPVDTIDETEESRQVTQIIKTTYFTIIDGRTNWGHLNKLFQFTQTSGTTPTHMTVPATVMNYNWVKYDKQKAGDSRAKFQEVCYKEPQDFLDMLDSRDNSKPNIDVITDPSGVTLNIRNDKAPEYWTTFDDKSIVMDAYDSGVESFLATTKTKAFGGIYPTWTDDDGTFVPDLPVDAFSYLLAEAKSVCFLRIKQAADQKAEQQSTDQRRRMSRQSWKHEQHIRYPNYGRR